MAIYNRNKDALPIIFSSISQEVFAGYDSHGNTVHITPNEIDSDSCRRIIFFDDFDGNELNADNWGYEIGGKVRGNELQYYRSTNNVTVHDSLLHIKAKRESYGGKEWTSGSITSQRLKTFRYGRIEARIKFPGITGAFCAFWMLGNLLKLNYVEEEDVLKDKPKHEGKYPLCGEIDITETIPGTRISLLSNIWDCSVGSSLGNRAGTDNTNDFHIYGMEWTSEYISLLYDGVEVGRYIFSDYNYDSIKGYIDKYFYIILNMAVGSAGGTPSSDCTEMDMYVDWVRVLAPLE